MFAACFDERNVMTKNKSEVEKIRLFLERWEGHNKAKAKVIVCQKGKQGAETGMSVVKTNVDLTGKKWEFVVAHGLWVKAECRRKSSPIVKMLGRMLALRLILMKGRVFRNTWKRSAA